MRRIIFISFFVTVILGACKKQLLEKNTGNIIENNASANAAVLCPGNTWAAAGYYRSSPPVLPLIYKNKAYVFSYNLNRLFLFDGANWDSMPMRIPFKFPPNIAFTIGDKGYLGGFNFFDPGSPAYFWQFDFITKTWSSKKNYPGNATSGYATFTLGNKAYVVGGQLGYQSLRDNWEYDPSTNSWLKKANLPIGIYRGAGFTIGKKGYFLNGTYDVANDNIQSIQLKSLYEYNPATDSWSTKTPFPGQVQEETHAFVIGEVAYAGGGYNDLLGVPVPAYYRYSPVTNAWVSVAGPQSFGYHPLVTFVINSKGYVMDGIPDGMVPSAMYPMYQYTPAACNTLSASQ